MYPKYSKEEILAVSNVLKSGKVSSWSGNLCKKFEQKFSKYHDLKYGVAVSNGSVALEIALKALDLPKKSEIIVTPRSFVISASCVLNLGYKAVFADVDDLGNLSAKSVIKKINNNTKAIILVHIDGNPIEMDEYKKIIKNKNIKIIEDCSQSHGAIYKNKKVGSFGDISIWSFCNDKIISTGGEGGMICTNNVKYYKKCWSIKDHGKNFKLNIKNSYSSSFKWTHDYKGSNYRLTELQAAIGIIQLKNLNNQLKKRRHIVNYLINNLIYFKNSKLISYFNNRCNGCIIKKTKCLNKCRHSYYRFNIILNRKYISKRNKIIRKLLKKKIIVGVGSCPTIYKEKVFTKNQKIKYIAKNAEELGKKIISFKIDPNLSKLQIKKFKDQIFSTLDNT